MTPVFDEDEVVEGLAELYGLSVRSLELLAGGLDRRAATYRAAVDGGPPVVVRLTAAPADAATYAVPRWLRDRGIAAVVAPLPARTGELAVGRHGLTWSVSPFVDGRDGWQGRMTDRHWAALGGALAAIHGCSPPQPVAATVAYESYDVAAYTEAVRRSDELVQGSIRDPAALAFATTWNEHRPTIQAMLAQMVRLADDLRDRPGREVLCHGDLHPGNVLVTLDDVHVVDWDGVLLAPRERDLLFVPGLPAPAAGRDTRGAAFLASYGIAEDAVDWVALTYFRCERVVQDVVEEAARAYDPDRADPAEADVWLRHVLQPGGEADDAVAAARLLPLGLNVLGSTRDRP